MASFNRAGNAPRGKRRSILFHTDARGVAHAVKRSGEAAAKVAFIAPREGSRARVQQGLASSAPHTESASFTRSDEGYFWKMEMRAVQQDFET